MTRIFRELLFGELETALVEYQFTRDELNRLTQERIEAKQRILKHIEQVDAACKGRFSHNHFATC